MDGARREDVVAVLRDPERFTTDHPRSPIGDIFGRQMLAQDGPAQKRAKAACIQPFSRRVVAEEWRSLALLVLWTVANLVISVRLAGTSRPTELSADGRTPIQVSVEARDLVLAEMRTMLVSVQGILDGATRSDTAAIRTAAAAAGLVMAADPALERVLPKAFLQLGMATHMAFDTLAATAGSGSAPAVEGLARITSRCVACHATYRLELR